MDGVKEMFIARQPIFNRSKQVYGYELLYRNQEQDVAFRNTTAQASTATVVGGLFELGIERIVNGKNAFVNFDYDFLMSDTIELIAPENLVIEVLETVRVDLPLIERLDYLKKRGYRIALDDFEETVADYPLIPLADIIKFDILLTPLSSLKNEVKEALVQGKYLLAEKIETEEEFNQAQEMGFHFFQGFFFSKPQIVGGVHQSQGSSLVFQKMIQELKTKEPSFQKLAQIVETDPTLAYRVMSVSGKAKLQTKTIKAALAKMGLLEIERWTRVLMMLEMGKNKPVELYRMALIRSRFGELIAENSSMTNRIHTITLMCLFSLIDAMLDLSMEEALKQIEIDEDVYQALVFQTGPLDPILNVIYCYERGTCDSVAEQAKQLGIDVIFLKDWYFQSIQWADQVMIQYQIES